LLELAPLNDQVYQVLRQRILQGELRAGARVDPQEISHDLGVSITPVKDALMRLSAEGFVEIKPRRGTSVKSLDRREIEEAFDIRLMMELYAVDRALEQATDTDTRYLTDLIANLETLTSGDEYTDYNAYVSGDRDLHSYLVRLAGNQRLSDLYDSINLYTRLIRAYSAAEGHVHGAAGSNAEHRAMVDAFAGRSAPDLKAALAQHLNNRLDYLRAFMGRHQADW
jgi:GntR family transcriptional regulator, rspAB operon transcriptional repressor